MEDARSDFVLAAAGMILGTAVVSFLRGLRFYPDGLLGAVLAIVWVFLLTIVVARFFVNYRQQGLQGYGLREDRGGLVEGALVAGPLLVAGYVRGLDPYGPLGAILGRAQPLSLDPTVGGTSPLEILVSGLLVAVGAVGAVMMYGLLTTRSREAFRSVEIPLVQALRTFGLGAVAISTVLGLMLSLGIEGLSPTSPLFDGIALTVTVLLADRAVAANDRTTRATVLAPAIVALVATIIAANGFSIFGSGLAIGLWLGTSAGAVVVVVASLIETRRAAWAVVPLIAVAMWSPTCTSLPVGGRLLQGCI